MKKIYQTPDTVLFHIGTTQMLMGSKVEDGFDKDEAPETEETSGNLSRRKNIWDDEEEDDDQY